MHVWFVSSGDYSNYGVEHIFATRALAQQFADGSGTGSRDDRRVEPDDDEGWELIETLPPAVPWLRLDATIKATGVESERDYHRTLYPGLDNPEPPVVTREDVYPSGVYGRTQPEYIHVSVSGTDVDRVKKTYSEVKARCLADFDVIIAAERERVKRDY